MASPISVDQFILATQNQLFNPQDGARERIALDLHVRPEQVLIQPGRPLRFTLVQPGQRTMHLDYHNPNARPTVHA